MCRDIHSSRTAGLLAGQSHERCMDVFWSVSSASCVAAKRFSELNSAARKSAVACPLPTLRRAVSEDVSVMLRVMAATTATQSAATAEMVTRRERTMQVALGVCPWEAGYVYTWYEFKLPGGR